MLDEIMDSTQEDISTPALLEKLKNEIEGANDRTKSSMNEIKGMMLERYNYLSNSLLVYMHASLTFKNLAVKTP